MEYVVGPILALLIGMKFTHYSVKEQQKKIDSVVETVDAKIVEQNTAMSEQTVRVLTPLVVNVKKINEQLGL